MVEVDASIDLELATKKDLERLFRENHPYCRKIAVGNSGLVNANGNANFRVYDVPDGYTFKLGKFICWGDNHNPSSGSVYTNAAAWCGLFHGSGGAANLADFWPKPEASTYQILPYTDDYGEFQAPEWRSPDNVWFYGTGLTVGENITVLLFGLLEAVTNAGRN